MLYWHCVALRSLTVTQTPATALGPDATAQQDALRETIARLLSEGAINARSAAKVLTTALRSDRPVHPSTVCRWITDGILTSDGRRVRLEGFTANRKWLTSKPAITRFLLAQQPVGASGGPAVRSPAEQRRGHSAALRELEANGGI
jgi:hypothetical protein